MTCHDVRDVLPDLLDARTPGAAYAEARGHLAGCTECQREFAALTQIGTALDTLPSSAPSSRLRAKFQVMLEEEKQTSRLHTAKADASPAVTPSTSRASRPLWRWIVSPLAGCALLALGFFAGQRSTPPPPAPTLVAHESTTQTELAALREQITQQRQQLDKMTTLVGYSILQQQQNPANERLRDVLAAARSENVNDKVLDDLIQALTLDPSANVRLRALEALFPHADRATVRAGVLAALPREQNPLVQLELIDFIATAQDPKATVLLEKLSVDESTNRSVRDAAKLALAQF